MPEKRPFVVRTHDIHLDSEYTQWIADEINSTDKSCRKGELRTTAV